MTKQSHSAGYFYAPYIPIMRRPKHIELENYDCLLDEEEVFIMVLNGSLVNNVRIIITDHCMIEREVLGIIRNNLFKYGFKIVVLKWTTNGQDKFNFNIV